MSADEFNDSMKALETPTKVFFFQRSAKDGGIAYALRYPSQRPSNVTFGHPCYECDTCRRRIDHLIGHYGPLGPLFLAPLDSSSCDGDGVFRTLKKKAQSLADLNLTPELVVITDDTYPPLCKGRRNGALYAHFTIIPDRTTPKRLGEDFSKLWNLTHRSMDRCLAKLLDPRIQDGLDVAQVAAAQSTRPEHWGSAIQWIRQLRAFADGKTFDEFTNEEKLHFRVKALAIGSFSATRHDQLVAAKDITKFLQESSDPGTLVVKMNQD